MREEIILTGIIVEESTFFTLEELSHASGKPHEWIVALVEEGVIEPVVNRRQDWLFQGYCLRRVRIIQRLESDLGLNLPGAALALQLLDEVETLRNRIAVLER
ncbi:MAG: chaperone modulator CbpM [Psychromonas sp.]